MSPGKVEISLRKEFLWFVFSILFILHPMLLELKSFPVHFIVPGIMSLFALMVISWYKYEGNPFSLITHFAIAMILVTIAIFMFVYVNFFVVEKPLLSRSMIPNILVVLSILSSLIFSWKATDTIDNNWGRGLVALIISIPIYLYTASEYTLAKQLLSLQ
jgi:hypothetical protein